MKISIARCFRRYAVAGGLLLVGIAGMCWAAAWHFFLDTESHLWRQQEYQTAKQQEVDERMLYLVSPVRFLGTKESMRVTDAVIALTTAPVLEGKWGDAGRESALFTAYSFIQSHPDAKNLFEGIYKAVVNFEGAQNNGAIYALLWAFDNNRAFYDKNRHFFERGRTIAVKISNNVYFTCFQAIQKQIENGELKKMLQRSRLTQEQEKRLIEKQGCAGGISPSKWRRSLDEFNESWHYSFFREGSFLHDKVMRGKINLADAIVILKTMPMWQSGSGMMSRENNLYIRACHIVHAQDNAKEIFEEIYKGATNTGRTYVLQWFFYKDEKAFEKYKYFFTEKGEVLWLTGDLLDQHNLQEIQEIYFSDSSRSISSKAHPCGG